MHGSEGWHLHWSAGGCIVEFVWRCCQTKSTSEKMHFPEFNCFLWSFKSGFFGHLMHWANYLISTCPGNGGLLFGLQWAEPFLGWIWFRGHCFWNLRASWRMGEYGRSKMRANALEGFRPGYKLQAVHYKFWPKGLQIPDLPDIHGKTTTQSLRTGSSRCFPMDPLRTSYTCVDPLLNSVVTTNRQVIARASDVGMLPRVHSLWQHIQWFIWLSCMYNNNNSNSNNSICIYV